MQRIPYACPDTREPLQATDAGLLRRDGSLYPYLPQVAGSASLVPNFLNLAAPGTGQRTSLDMYNTQEAAEFYRNFLDWLFATFEQDESQFRRSLVARMRLSEGQTALVTGCGLGDDIPAILEVVGPKGEVHAQDLAPAMVQAAAQSWGQNQPQQAQQIAFTTGNAQRLPYADAVFDAAYHFGGINLFDDIGQGIAEMARVVRSGGRIVISDEGVAPWLKDTDFGRMVITNNKLWGLSAPISLLPQTASEVGLSWVLGNCFWVIEFTVSDAMPHLNPHIPHKGRRGGSMWTRYCGQLEGVTPETRDKVLRAAQAAGESVHGWLERVIADGLQEQANDQTA